MIVHESGSLTSRLPRRDFLALAGRGALWATLGGSAIALARFLSFAEPQPSAVYTLDTPDAYPAGAFTPVADGRAYLGRDERGLYAVVATCTHLGCLVKHAGEGFECPCHGSRFDEAGSVTQGPAARPLQRAALALDAEGRVVLDLRQAVGEDFRLNVG
jgi:nitrite reductase/ring-hydroxylating ferredoxin subunit